MYITWATRVVVLCTSVIPFEHVHTCMYMVEVKRIVTLHQRRYDVFGHGLAFKIWDSGFRVKGLGV